MGWQKAFALSLFLVLISGCATQQPSMNLDKANTLQVSGTGDNRNVGRDSCRVMICQKGTGTATDDLFWWYQIFNNQFAENTLYLGKCFFLNKNSADLRGLMQSFATDQTNTEALKSASGSQFIRTFMYGQGPTFAEFDAANAYCNSDLSLAIKWMTNPRDTTDVPYVGQKVWEAKLQRSKAECYLRANVLPAYIFYTNSTLSAMDVTILKQFLGNFQYSGAEPGPMIIDPEYNFSATNPAVLERVKDMVKAIRDPSPGYAGCKDCMIMLSPGEGGMDALDKIFTTYPELLNYVDIIGQSWTLNMDDNCDFYDSFNTKLDFSKSVLAKYNLPTLIVYLSAVNTYNYKRTCKWSDSSIASAYDLIYTNTPALTEAGIIGLGNYQLLDGNDAQMKCRLENCSLGLLTADETQKPMLFPMWFQKCKDYYSYQTLKDQAGNTHVVNTNEVPLTFNYFGDNGTTCDAYGQYGTYSSLSVSTAPTALPALPIAPPPQVYNCNRCFWNGTFNVYNPDYSNQPPLIYLLPSDLANALPFAWYPTYFNDFQLAMQWNNNPATVVSSSGYCSDYAASIGKASEASCTTELDPYFMKAVAAHDSDLGKCAVNYARVSDVNCNPGGIDPVTDPSGTCPSVSASGYKYNVVTKKCETGVADPTAEDCKVCTYGLARCPNMSYSQETYSGSEPYGCGPNFNPFNPQMGLCCGVNTLCTSMSAATKWAYSDPGRITALSLSSNDQDWAYLERDKYTILLLTLALYHNNGDTTVLDAAYNDWLDTKWCPNSLLGSDGPEGPRKAALWNYCYVYNDTGGKFYSSFPILDPWGACVLASGFDTTKCHLDCCNAGEIAARNADGTAFLEYDTLFDPAIVPRCASSSKCCDSFYINTNFDSTQTFNTLDRSNDPKYCCGGSFAEHLCCLDPYACEVMNDYQSTLASCDPNGYCKRT